MNADKLRSENEDGGMAAITFSFSRLRVFLFCPHPRLSAFICGSFHSSLLIGLCSNTN